MLAGRLIVASLATLLAVGPLAAADGLAQILVSRQLLARSGHAVGDVVQLSAHPDGRDARSFRVAGAYEPIPDPMRLYSRRFEARLHLPDLLALAAAPGDREAPDTVRAINVVLRDPAGAAAFARELTGRAPYLGVSPTVDSGERTQTFLVIDRFHRAIAIVTVIGSSMFLLALMVLRADERRETIGTLRLLGFSRSRILGEVLVEGLCIAIAGAVFGVVFALAMQGAFNRFFQWWYDTPLVFVRIDASIVLQSMAIALPLGLLAGLAASSHLVRREIVALLGR